MASVVTAPGRPRAADVTDRPAAVGSGYRPHLDGLRAVAVYLVVLFHAGVDRFSGGFIGVDVFFVLSGYLVTQLLLRDHRACGRIRFARFYSRRFRRLLPAAFVALVATAIVYTAIASPGEMQTAIGGFKAAFTYVTNWFFIRQSSNYFGGNVNASPVQQFWSLAVEEQFYFVWPLILSGLLVVTARAGRWSRRALQVAVALGGLLSLGWALHLSSYDLSRAYYGTDTRAYQLLAGASLALCPGLMRRAVRFRATAVVAPVALVGLVVLASSAVGTNAVRRGVLATVLSVALIVGTEAMTHGPVARLLSWSPVVYLGRISYGTYLWHWPVILVALAVTDHTISPASTFVLAAAIATGLASLSYQVVERPVRGPSLLDGHARAVIVVGLAVSVASAFVLIPRIIDPYRGRGTGSTTASGASTRFTPVPAIAPSSTSGVFRDQLHGVRFPGEGTNSWTCVGRSLAPCTIVHGHGAHLLLTGDSQAWSLFPTFVRMAQQHDLTLSVSASASCPWQRHLTLDPAVSAVYRERSTICTAMKDDLVRRMIPRLRPDIVITVGLDYDRPSGHVLLDGDGRPTRLDAAALDRSVRADTQGTVADLAGDTRTVVMLETPPVALQDHDPTVCLAHARYVEDCRFIANTAPTSEERIYRSLADRRRIIDLDIDRMICPYMPICDPIVNGRAVRSDYAHISPEYGITISDAMFTALRDSGALHPR